MSSLLSLETIMIKHLPINIQHNIIYYLGIDEYFKKKMNNVLLELTFLISLNNKHLITAFKKISFYNFFFIINNFVC